MTCPKDSPLVGMLKGIFRENKPIKLFRFLCEVMIHFVDKEIVISFSIDNSGFPN